MDSKTILETFDQLKSERSNLDQELEKCAQYACPEKSFIGGGNGDTRKRPKEIIIDEVSEANTTLARGLYSNLCPANMRWFTLESGDIALKDNEEVKTFYNNATSEIYRLLMNSNFAMEANEGFEDIGWCGLINLYIERDFEKCFKFRNIHINDYYIREDADGRIDTLYRVIELTARQVVQKYKGESDDVPKKVQEDAESESPERRNRKYTVIHAVEPNYDVKYDSEGVQLPGNENKKFKSYHVLKETKDILRESGYDYLPYNIARFEKKAKSAYGFCPARRVLRTAGITNRIWHTNLRMAEKIVDPPVNIPVLSTGKIKSPQHYYNPKSVNYYEPQSGGKPEYQPVPSNLPVGLEIFDRLVDRIDSAFFVNMFQMIERINDRGSAGRDRTAFEIRQLVAEKQQMIIPVVSRILEEFFTPLIIKCFNIAVDLGFIPAPPAPINRESIKVNFVSPLALATKMVEINIFFDSLQSVLPLAEYNEEVLDVFKLKEAAAMIVDYSGVHPDLIRTKAEQKIYRDAINKQRQEAVQSQQMADIAKSQDMNKRPEDESMVDLMKNGAYGNMING